MSVLSVLCCCMLTGLMLIREVDAALAWKSKVGHEDDESEEEDEEAVITSSTVLPSLRRHVIVVGDGLGPVGRALVVATLLVLAVNLTYCIVYRLVSLLFGLPLLIVSSLARVAVRILKVLATTTWRNLGSITLCFIVWCFYGRF